MQRAALSTKTFSSNKPWKTKYNICQDLHDDFLLISPKIWEDNGPGGIEQTRKKRTHGHGLWVIREGGGERRHKGDKW